MRPTKKTKVLIVDDSALIRAVLTEVLSSEPRIEVVGSAVDPYDAREKIKLLKPDVLTLDIEMPKMSGIAFLKNLMRLRPMPVVMISTLTQEGAPATLEALELGAVDFIPKPVNEGASALEKYREDIVAKVLSAATANVRSPNDIPSRQETTPDAPKEFRQGFICAMGASTGGTEAIKEVVCSLPERSPPILITQHIPPSFSASFAKRVDRQAAVNVYEATHNQKINPGCVYIAPGNAHLTVKVNGYDFLCQLDNRDPVNRHKPSVEVMFDSVGSVFGKNVLAVMLTGMGGDGAEAMLRLRKAGCSTIAQDEASSVVWGMPGVAYKIGAAEKLVSLDKIARYIVNQAAK